jgi:hypothetical protein
MPGDTLNYKMVDGQTNQQLQTFLLEALVLFLCTFQMNIHADAIVIL